MTVFFYILFFYSGLIKSILLFYNIDIQIDFTLLSGALLTFNIALSLIKNNFKIRISKTIFYSSLALLLFSTWIFFTLFFTPSKEYAFIKSFYFLTNLLIFLYPLIINNFNVKSFIKLNLLFVLTFAIWYFWVDLNSSSFIYLSVKYYIYSSLYLTISTLLGLNLLIFLTAGTSIFKKKIYDIIIVFITIGFMFLIRGRGPLIFAVFTSILYLIYNTLKSKKIKFKISINKIITASFIFSLFITIGIFIIIKFEDEIFIMLSQTLKRFDVMLSGVQTNDMGASVNTRMLHINASIDLIFNNTYNFITGYGIGSYRLLFEGIDGRLYPHNIILEITVEIGLIGLILFSIYLFFNLLYSKKHNIYISYFVIIYIILNVLKSSSLVDLRIYFAIFSLFLILNTNKKTV